MWRVFSSVLFIVFARVEWQTKSITNNKHSEVVGVPQFEQVQLSNILRTVQAMPHESIT